MKVWRSYHVAIGARPTPRFLLCSGSPFVLSKMFSIFQDVFQLTRRLLSLNRSRLNEVLQVLTGHCNLQKHRKTTGRDESPTCPKCNLEEETPNHHIGACTYYQALRRKVFGKEKTTIKSVVQKLNINLLAKYLQQAGRLAEYGQ